MKELIKEIPEYPNYFITSKGTVLSTKSGVLKVMKIQLSHTGKRYPNIRIIHKTRGARTVCIHNLVYRTFVGEIPQGLFVLHRDDNRLNFDLQNLYVGDRDDNIEDAKRNGKIDIGERCHNATLKNDDVKEIKKLSMVTTLTNRQLAWIFDTKPSIISRILRGDRWADTTVANFVPQDRGWMKETLENVSLFSKLFLERHPVY